MMMTPPSESDIFPIIPLSAAAHQSVLYKPHRRRAYVRLLAIGERADAEGMMLMKACH